MAAESEVASTEAARILDESRAAGRTALSEPQAKGVIASLGIRVPSGVFVGPGGAFSRPGAASDPTAPAFARTGLASDLAAVASLRAPLVAKLV
ncbi:MAG TPA: hypothetical protein PK359_23960, partial [Burkholderiaceae bacterium]|nr:hypothetical protein [Burkholderiaceae bacterium]